MGGYLSQYSDDDRFPGGESIKDLAERAKSTLEKLVLPRVWEAAKEGKAGIHVAVISHGLCIGELISELLKMNVKLGQKYEGHLENTDWT